MSGDPRIRHPRVTLVGWLWTRGECRARLASISNKMADEQEKNKEGVLSRKTPSLTPEEAVLQVDRLKERLRSFSASSSFSTEGSDDGKSDGSRSRLARKQDDLFSCLSVMRRLMELIGSRKVDD